MEPQETIDLIDLAILCGITADRFSEILHASWEKGAWLGLELLLAESRTGKVSPDRAHEIAQASAEKIMFLVLEQLLLESNQNQATQILKPPNPAANKEACGIQPDITPTSGP